MEDLTKKAIQAALEGKWEEAVDYNLAILRDDPNDIAALNRLGHAYTELDATEKARETYKNVLELDKYNPIATKNLKRLKVRQKITPDQKQSSPAIHANFLEEPGKTKTTQLVRLADADVIANLRIGQPLIFKPKKRIVSVITQDGTYIGSLPDDLAFALGKLLRLGNKYEVLIKSIDGSNIQIFIRETYRSSRLKNTPSFPTTATVSYYSDLQHRSVLKEEPLDVSQTGEQDEP